MRWGTYMYMYISNCEFVKINLHVLHIIGNTKLIINTVYIYVCYDIHMVTVYYF